MLTTIPYLLYKVGADSPIDPPPSPRHVTVFIPSLQALPVPGDGHACSKRPVTTTTLTITHLSARGPNSLVTLAQVSSGGSVDNDQRQKEARRRADYKGERVEKADRWRW